MSFYEELEDRLTHFSSINKKSTGSEAISIKIRAESGCFHESCCPHAFKLINEKIMNSMRNEYEYIKHESGPEIIAYISLTASGLLLAKSVIELITAIIKARFEGQKKGDNHKGDPVTLIIRKTKEGKTVIEEKIMTFYPKDEVADEIIIKLLTDGYKELEKKSKGNKSKT